jgi:hypothetical protein
VKKHVKQWGLFQGPENVKTEDAKLASLEPPKPYDAFTLRRKIVRGFLSLHFEEDPEELLKRPLETLLGRTLESFLISDYAHVQAWMQESRLHPDHRILLTQASA